LQGATLFLGESGNHLGVVVVRVVTESDVLMAYERYSMFGSMLSKLEEVRYKYTSDERFTDFWDSVKYYYMSRYRRDLEGVEVLETCAGPYRVEIDSNGFVVLHGKEEELRYYDDPVYFMMYALSRKSGVPAHHVYGIALEGLCEQGVLDRSMRLSLRELFAVDGYGKAYTVMDFQGKGLWIRFGFAKRNDYFLKPYVKIHQYKTLEFSLPVDASLADYAGRLRWDGIPKDVENYFRWYVGSGILTLIRLLEPLDEAFLEAIDPVSLVE